VDLFIFINEMPTEQARYWIFIIPRDDWEPSLPDGCQWIYGQPELGDFGYCYWQFIAAWK